MKDRFKFRAWDTVDKKMHENDFVVTATGHIAKLWQRYEKGENEMYFSQTDFKWDNELILLQCTGLEDKNQHLIFEGDIVKSYNDEICVIKHCVDEGGFYIGSDEGLNHSFDTLTFKFEVIGNIWENSNLLEVQNGL